MSWGGRYLLGSPPGDLALPRGWELLPDSPPARGPLSGYLSLARRCPDGFVLVGGDMPFLRPAPLVGLWQASRGESAAALLDGDHLHPLLVALRPGAYATLEALLEGSRSPGPRLLLERIGARGVSAREIGLEPEEASLLTRDVDTPERLEEARKLAREARLRRLPGSGRG